MDNFYDYQNNDINLFIKNYREALKAQRDSTVKQLDQQRRNDYAKIMSGANKMGMMYGNLGERAKIKYNTENYMPNYVKIQNTYSTALDSLRNNAVKLWNTIRSYREATDDLNNDIV